MLIKKKLGPRKSDPVTIGRNKAHKIEAGKQLGKPERPKMEVRSYDEEFLALAAKQAQAESKSLGGGNRISTKGGHFSINGVMIKGIAFRAVVVDTTFFNAWFPKPYQQDAIVSPSCYAFSADGEGMEPHKEADEPQHTECDGCPCAVFGTSNTGKGKACKNMRRLGLILEEDLETDNPDIYTLDVAVTGVKGWASYVQQVTASVHRPTCGVLTELSIAQAPGKTYAVVSFGYERALEAEELEAVLPRREEAYALLTRPYPKPEAEEAPKRPAGPKKFTPKASPAPVAKKKLGLRR